MGHEKQRYFICHWNRHIFIWWSRTLHSSYQSTGKGQFYVLYKKESYLGKGAQHRIFWFKMSFIGTHLTAEGYGTIYPLRQMHQYTRSICRYWGRINEPCKHQLFSHLCINEAVAAAGFNTFLCINSTLSSLTSKQKLYSK